MRFPIRRVGAAVASLLVWGAGMLVSAPAAAQCMGVARTITVDPARGSFYNGLERSLGLRDGEVILTFDDGPVPGKTTRILDALRAECTKATFFMAGRMVDAYPAIAQRVRREGHSLASHTYSHNNLAKASSSVVAASISKGEAAIKRATGLGSVPFFRYPYLAKSARTDAIVRSKGLIAFGTNIDSKDYFKVSPDAVRAKTMAQLRKQRKGIVLMHDIHGRTAAMLPALLDQMKAEGFKVVHMVPGRGRPVADPVLADTVLAKAAPEKRRDAPVASARAKPDAMTGTSGRTKAVLAAFARPEAKRDRAARRLDVLARPASKSAMTPAQKRRARRAIRQEFKVVADWSGGRRGSTLLRLTQR